MYALKANLVPSFVILFMGTMDCVTTVIGVLFYGASETNPILIGVINSNIALFSVLKLTATFGIAGTYTLSKIMLDRTMDKSTRSFRFGNLFLKVVFSSIALILMAVVFNNFVIMMT